MVGAHQVQAQVDPGGDPRAGHHRTGVDVADVGIDLDVRVAGGQLAGVPPVDGGPKSVEQAGGDREGVALALVAVAEDLGGDGQVEGDDLRQRHCHDPVYGSILAP